MVEREARARKRPNYDGLCFHAQQCVEKYLKARLCEAGIEFPKTHVLAALLDLVAPVEPLWETYREHFIFSPVLRSASVILASLLTGKPHWTRANAAGCSGAWRVKRWGWNTNFSTASQRNHIYIGRSVKSKCQFF